jgi:dTDP-4-amino-4,6-dideoxygalactose transaminase
VKLPHLAHWNQRRRAIAARYQMGLAGLALELPKTAEGSTHVYHVYAVLSDRRDALQEFLNGRGVPTIIYYPKSLHLQKVYRDLGYHEGDFPVAEHVAKRILPLPMYPELTDEQVDYVIATLREFCR